MAWLFGLVVLVVFIIVLVKFPKPTLITIGVLIVIGIISWYVGIEKPEKDRKLQESLVTVDIKFDSKECPDMFYPLRTRIVNKSKKTVEKVTWYLGAYEPGFSTDLSGYNDSYKNDKILSPGEGWQVCYNLPGTIEPNHDFSKLQYKAEMKNVSWQD